MASKTPYIHSNVNHFYNKKENKPSGIIAYKSNVPNTVIIQMICNLGSHARVNTMRMTKVELAHLINQLKKLI